jgi:serine/threonine protein kinase
MVYGFARCKERNIFYIVMEKAPGITLYNYVCYTDIPFLSRLFIAKNICRTIARLHERNVMYRDLKPDNIVIDPTNNHHVLIDFGLAVQCTSMSDCVDGMVGTPGYMAPEIYREQTYSFPVDIYSLGMTLYFLFRCREAERLSVLRYHLHHSNTPKFIQSYHFRLLMDKPVSKTNSQTIVSRFCRYLRPIRQSI